MFKSNVDAVEVANFSAMAPAWWLADGEFKALHDINPVRLAYVDQRAGLPEKHVLDVGCGGGLLAEAMAAKGARVVGIDMVPAAIAVAKTHADQSNLSIDYQQSTAEDWAQKHREGYDIVTCMELIEHVPDPAQLVRACAQLVRPGGDLFFATVNRTLLARLLVIWASEYLFGIVRKGTHTYHRFVRPQELLNWGQEAGLTPSNVTGLRYIPFWGYTKLCNNTLMNYLVHFKATERMAHGLMAKPQLV